MPIVIGAKRESDFTDPIGLLTDCHRLLETFLNALGSVAEQQQGAAARRGPRRAVEQGGRMGAPVRRRRMLGHVKGGLFQEAGLIGRLESGDDHVALDQVDDLHRDELTLPR